MEPTSADLIKEAGSLESELKNKRFDACNTDVDADNIKEQLQDLSKMKVDFKEMSHKLVTMNHFMRNLSMIQDEWPSLVSKSEEEHQTAKNDFKKAKQMVKEQKAQNQQLNSVVVQGLTVYEQNVEALSEKIMVLDDMMKEYETLIASLEDSGDAEDEALSREMQVGLEKFSEQMKECKKQLLQISHSNEQLELHISQVQDEVQQVSLLLDKDAECMEDKCLANLLKSIKDMESLSGILCKPVSANKAVVEFPPTVSSQQTGGSESKDDLCLKVTLTFEENSLGYLRVSDIKSNMDSFDLEDLWKDFVEDSSNSLPQLINSIKLRWFSHLPLLSEINQLRSKFAIDWIQQESVLRVIVGKGGGIVCSLDIPSGYPHQGQVALTGIIGAADSIVLQDLKPQTGKRLEDWVKMLEDTFGKP